jgi:hypothetical protein
MFTKNPDSHDSMERCQATQSDGSFVTMESAIIGCAGASTPQQQAPACSSSNEEEKLTLASPQTPSFHLKKLKSQAPPSSSGRGTRRPRPEAEDAEQDAVRRRIDMLNCRVMLTRVAVVVVWAAVAAIDEPRREWRICSTTTGA